MSSSHKPWLRWVAAAAITATSVAAVKLAMTDGSSKSAIGVAATALDSMPPLSVTPPTAQSVGAAAANAAASSGPAPQANVEAPEDMTASEQARKKPSFAREKKSVSPPRTPIPVTPAPADVAPAPAASPKREIVTPPTPAKARKADSFDPTTFGGRL